jgi:hypothetical protein
MSDDFPREDGKSPHDDAGTPENLDAQKPGQGDAAIAADGEMRGRGDAGEIGGGDGETRGREDHKASESVDAGDVDVGTRGRGGAGSVPDADMETHASQRSVASQNSTQERGDAETAEEEAFLASEEDFGGLTEGSALGAGEPQAAPAVELAAREESPINEAPAPAVDRRKAPRGPRPALEEEREPVFHDEGGYRMRMEPAALAKLRELPGAKGKTDRELGEEFFKGQSARLVASMAGDVETPADVRVVVDPYSRQAFLAVGRTIRGIVSF